MKTRLPRQLLQDALSAIATIAGGRTTKPILSCVHIIADGEVVRLGATDGEAALQLGVPVLATEKIGRAVIPATRLLEIIREMPDAEVLITADERYCVVKGAASEFKIFVQSPDDFPPIGAFEGEPDLVVDGAKLSRLISMTVYAAARETSRFAINGVLWEKQGKRLYLVATDGRRLARAGGSIDDSRAADFQAIVPTKALQVFERVFAAAGGDGWTVDVKIMPNQIMLRSGESVLSTALVEGHFPDYRTVIPQDGSRLVRLDRVELHGAVRRAALLTTEDSRAVKLSFERDKLTIRSNSPEQGEAKVEVPAHYDGGAIDIGFNPIFLVDALKAIPYENVTIELSETFKPGVVFGEDKNDFLYVIMPVSL